MKWNLLFFSLFIILCGRVLANENQQVSYERTLKDFKIEEGDKSDKQLIDESKKVYFTLDNGSVFTSEIGVFDEHKLFSLNKLLNTRVYIRTEPDLSGLEISFENPSKKGYTRLTFQAAITYETYHSALYISDIQLENHWWYGSNAYLILSDGSKWRAEGSAKENIKNYYALGDRVLVTRSYYKSNLFSLVNLDMSSINHFIYYNVNGVSFPAGEARNILVYPCSTP